MWRSLAVSVLSFALPLTANAIPILRLALTGDASRLGAGAISPFTVYTLDALHLDRPALLADITQPLLRLEVTQEKTIELDGPQFFEGTRARDEQATLIVAVPTRILGRRLTFLASGELREGLLRIESKMDGLITQVNEHRGRGSFGFAFEPWSRLRIGAAASISDGLSGSVEAVGTFGPFQLGAQQRYEDLGYTLKIPKGPPAKLQRPELDYPIHAQRQTSTLTARLQTSWTDSAVALDLWTRDPVIDSALFLGPWLTLRGHYEQLHLEFDNWASNKGVPVARIDLDMVVSRWAVGAELRWGRHEFVFRVGETALSTQSSWVDNGEITGMQFFSLPIDLGLSLQQLFQARISQWSIGWNWNLSPVIASLGLQRLHLHNNTGGYTYGSSVDVAFGGRHVVAPAEFEAVAFTGGISWVVGKMSFHIAIAQLVPITGPGGGTFAAPAAPTPSTPSNSNNGAPAPSGPSPTTDGGRLIKFDVNQTF